MSDDELDVRMLLEAFYKLERLAPARNREVDKEPRTVELTDDEALAIFVFLKSRIA